LAAPLSFNLSRLASLVAVGAPQINSGNSGGPAFNSSGLCVGIAFQSLKHEDAENIGYIIPTPVIQHFITDYERNGAYTGFPCLGVEWQKMENPDMRRALKMKVCGGTEVAEAAYMSSCSIGQWCTWLGLCATHPAARARCRVFHPALLPSGVCWSLILLLLLLLLCAPFPSSTQQPEQKGVLIRRIEPTAPVSKVLSQYDILQAFDGTEIANDGTVPFRSGERISFSYLVSQVGDRA
jgi:hypothetical protein